MRSVVFHERFVLSEVLMEVGMEGLREEEGNGGGESRETTFPLPPPPKSPYIHTWEQPVRGAKKTKPLVPAV